MLDLPVQPLDDRPLRQPVRLGDVVLLLRAVDLVAGLGERQRVRAHRRQARDPLLAEPVRAVPVDEGFAHVIAESLVVGDGDVHAAVAVEVGRQAAGRGVRAQPREVAGAESRLPVAPVDERIHVPVDGALVAAAQQVRHSVAVEVGDRQAVTAVGRELRLPVGAQPVGTIPEDVVERVVRLAGIGLAAAEQQVGVAVAGDVVRHRIAGAERGGQHE